MRDLKRPLRLMALASVLGLTTTFAGCGKTGQAAETRAVVAAAQVLGESQAGVQLAPLPDECREHVGLVQPTVGERPRWTQLRWEYVKEAADARVDTCAAFYDEQKELLQ